jgi:hypothetical protein
MVPIAHKYQQGPLVVASIDVVNVPEQWCGDNL